jgi:hypothetical protein
MTLIVLNQVGVMGQELAMGGGLITDAAHLRAPRQPQHTHQA